MKAHRIYILCFLLSGAASLIYQIVWIRMFSLVFGNTVYAVSMVVAGFLTGLALGSHFWGKHADKLKNPLNTYIGLEISIAVSAIFISALVPFIDDVIVSAMTIDSLGSSGWQAVRFVLLFIILLIPTTLMGGTLPVMGKFYVKSLDRVGHGIGSLYAANTYGAMLGCFISGYLLIKMFGVWGALYTAFLMNLAIALLASSVGGTGMDMQPEQVKRRSTPRPKQRKEKKSSTKVENNSLFDYKVSIGLALALGMVAGFCALAFEILWTRAFVVSFKTTVYLLSNLLAVYLLGLALGSHVFSKWLDGLKDPLKLFGLVQIGIGVWGLITVPLLYKSPGMALGIADMFSGMNLTKDVFIQLFLMSLVMLPPTFLMGLAYPLICRVTTRSLDSIGRYAGLVYTVGTVGGIIGSLTAGFILLPMLGLQYGLVAVSLIALAAGYVSLLSASSRKGVGWVFPASGATVLILVVAVGISGINIGLGAALTEKIVFAQEGVMGTVRVTQKKEKGPLTLFVNNYQLATSGDVAVRFGHIPLLLNPDSKDVLLISLGSGITAGAVAAHDLDTIECVEIVPSLLDAQSLFVKENHNVTADKRFKLTFWDGRHYVRVADHKYDLVISDLFQPDSAGVGSLYSLEHFLNVKAKLKKGGAMAQWLPLYQLSPENLKVIMRTFATAFENVIVWAGDINSQFPTIMLYGSTEPVQLKPDRLMQAMQKERVKEDMIEFDDPLSFLSFFIMNRDDVIKFTEGYRINTDNHPVIEYTSPKYLWSRKQNAVNNFVSLLESRKKFNVATIGASEDNALQKAVQRYFESRTMILKGKVEHARRNYPKEFELYKSSAKLTPSDPWLGLSVFDLGYVYFHRRDYNTASRIFEWAKEINPNLLESHFYLAKSYQYLGKREKSAAAINELARLKPEIAEALIAR